MRNKIILGLVAVLVVIQFFQIDKVQPEADPKVDFISLEQPPQEVENLLRSACYDCHSYESEYPWYTNIQPVAWWIDYHIDHSQEYLNFSEWGNYTYRRADHKAEEVIEYVENKEMPLPSYRIMHPEARLSDDQRQVLMDYFVALRADMKVEQEAKEAAEAADSSEDSSEGETSQGAEGTE